MASPFGSISLRLPLPETFVAQTLPRCVDRNAIRRVKPRALGSVRCYAGEQRKRRRPGRLSSGNRFPPGSTSLPCSWLSTYSLRYRRDARRLSTSPPKPVLGRNAITTELKFTHTVPRQGSTHDPRCRWRCRMACSVAAHPTGGLETLLPAGIEFTHIVARDRGRGFVP